MLRIVGRQTGYVLVVVMARAGGTVAATGPSTDEIQDPARQGLGWSIIQQDLDIRVLTTEERMELQGVLRLRLDALAESYGPTLYMNTRLNKADAPVMKYTRVESEHADVEISEALLFGRVRQTHVRFHEAKPKGSEIVVKFAWSAGRSSEPKLLD